MHGRLDLAAIRRIAAFGGGIVDAAQFGDLTRSVLHHFATLDEISVAQPHFGARRQPEELLGRIFHEVVLLDVEFAAKRDFTRAGGRIVRVIDGFELFRPAFRVILDHHLERPQYRHAPQRRLVEKFADAELQHADIDDAVGLGDPDTPNEFADRGRRYTTPLQAGDGRHARIVPAGDVAAADEFGQNPLRQ